MKRNQNLINLQENATVQENVELAFKLEKAKEVLFGMTKSKSLSSSRLFKS
jgi:hypothetical protein